MRRRARRRSARRGRSRLRAYGLVFALLTILALAPATALLLFRWADPPQSSFMVARRFAEPGCGELGFEWVDRAALPTHVSWSAVAAEDQRFVVHRGFDYASIERALRDRLEGDRLRGASTISQQVSKNLFLWEQRSWVRKGLEAYLTLWLETLWPKTRILEVYLNVAQFGPCTFGVEAASRRYFRKPASRLSEREAALLMTALPNPDKRRPDRPTPYLLERAQGIARDARALSRRWPTALKTR